MALLGDELITDLQLVSIPTLQLQHGKTAKYVLTNLLSAEVLAKTDLDQAEKGIGNNDDIAMLRWLLHHHTIDRLQIHQAMQHPSNEVNAHEMVQFTNFLAPIVPQPKE